MKKIASKLGIGRYDAILAALFLCSLPLVNPWVRGDGVGYYAYARAIVVNHNLQFQPDWLHANASFYEGRVDANGQIRAEQFTATGHLNDHSAIGAALIWMPFLEITHLGVLSADRLGARVPANGFSWPYTDTMAIITALAGFFGLWFSFRLARKYFPECWAFLATLGIWLASSLIVYMYFNPSWSHAHSVFVVALFLWYWDRTRNSRSIQQWVSLGLIAGLMLDVYYPTAVFLLIPAMDLVWLAIRNFRTAPSEEQGGLARLLLHGSVFSVAVIFAFLPTLITRAIIYGSPFSMGYDETSVWRWGHPLWGAVLFSSDHGLFSWTPILLLACIGLVFVLWRDRVLGVALLISAFAFYFLIATYPDWDGISSFGNRFFISLTPVFIIGLAALLANWERVVNSRRLAESTAAAVLALLALWNFGLLFQWGMHLIPERGPIEWNVMIANQFHAVPEDMAGSLGRYFTGRRKMMQAIEAKDVHQLASGEQKGVTTTHER